jgi:DNA-binding response OmpR family regulator
MASKQNLNILLVEPDDDVMNVTTRMLERLGYTVHGEKKSLTALRTFSENADKFDLAIVEPLMPDLMGTELAVRFGRIRRGFPVLFYTGYLDPSLEQAIGDTGVGWAVTKPLGPRELGKAVKERLHWPSPDIR